MASARSRSHRFLPPDPRVSEPYRLTPQLALRIGILGTIVLAAFAVLFLRLWALQVLSGTQYAHAAQNNNLRTVRVQAPRGAILDRNGDVLVENTVGYSIQIWPAELPREGRYDVLRRLSAVVGVPPLQMAREIEERKGDPLTPVTVKRGVHDDQVNRIAERADEFPGVVVAESYLRAYPFKTLAAHLVGHVGEASPEQMERRKELRLGDEVGQGGIEAAYDEFLRGKPGLARLRVDSLGRPRGDLIRSVDPLPGHAVRTTIDRKLQQAAERALREGISLAHARKQWYADGGAIVALDPRTGEVLALASNPTYRPALFVGRKDRKKLEPLLNPRVAEEENLPGLNRAIAGEYPPGSTFKPVTALAAMQEHLITPYEYLLCRRSFTRYNHVFNNWDPYVYRYMGLPEALSASCDTYFYELGDRFYRLPPDRGHPLQDWARRLGIGVGTGIDIGPEETGLLPTPEWRQRTYEREEDEAWKPGDSIQLAIGQKDLLVTPLQMARFYALVANGGKLVTPHLAAQVEQPGGGGDDPDVLQRFTPPVPRESSVDPEALEVVRRGLYSATHSDFGTSSWVFADFPVEIAGKTGTAEKMVDGINLDQAWWCGYGPYEAPELVVCVLIENGGHGGEVAAPSALKVFEAYFGERGVVEPLRPSD